MASVNHVKRALRGGGERWHVRLTGSRFDRATHLGSFDTEREAITAASRARLMLEEGVVPTRETVARHRVAVGRIQLRTVYEAWAASRIDVKDSTMRTYKALAQHALATLGDRDVRSITPDDVQAWIIGLVAAKNGKPGVEPRSLPKYRRVLSQILDYARVDPNPAKDALVKNPISDDADFRIPTVAELAVLYPALAVRNRMAVMLLEHTGLRCGEAVALRWEDREAAKHRFRVRKSKTKAGIRWVEDLPEYPDELVALLDTPAKRRPLSAYVLEGRSAGAVAAALRHGCERAGIRHYSPHDFRHLHASRLIRAGWDPVRVAARIGHSRPAMTLDVYSHVIVPE